MTEHEFRAMVDEAETWPVPTLHDYAVALATIHQREALAVALRQQQEAAIAAREQAARQRVAREEATRQQQIAASHQSAVVAVFRAVPAAPSRTFLGDVTVRRPRQSWDAIATSAGPMSPPTSDILPPPRIHQGVRWAVCTSSAGVDEDTTSGQDWGGFTS